MKKKNIKNILKNIFIIICIIVSIIYIILSKNYKLAIKLILMAIVLLISALIFTYSIIKEYFVNKKITKYYNFLKTKTDTTLFEECFILSFQNKLDNLIKLNLGKKKIKNINNLKTLNINTNQISVTYKYIGFEVFIFLMKDEIYYTIDSPTRYDGIKNNIDFEKFQKIDLSLNNFILIDSLLLDIAELIYNINYKIDTFAKENLVDELFNGRLLNKLKDYLSFLNREGLICTIFGLPLTLFFSWGIAMAFIDVNFKMDNPIGFYLVLILCPAISLLFIYGFFHGISCLVIKQNFKKDFKQKRFLSTNNKPYKISIGKEKPGKYSNTMFLTYATIHYKKLTLILPLPRKAINNPKNMKKCYKECLKLQKNLKYLPKSKIIIDGAEMYINIINKYLT